MAYIDIKVERVDYRVILAHHEFETSVRQLPESCTGVLLEGFSRDPKELAKFGATVPFQTQYKGIMEFARQRNLPVVMAEPIYAKDFPYGGLGRLALFPLMIAILAVGNYLVLDINKIDRQGKFFKTYDAMVQFQTRLPDQNASVLAFHPWGGGLKIGT